jgi:hypothetical protein
MRERGKTNVPRLTGPRLHVQVLNGEGYKGLWVCGEL